MYKQTVVSVFLYSPFSNIGGVFRYVRQCGGQLSSKNSHIFAMNGLILTLLISYHSVLTYLAFGLV